MNSLQELAEAAVLVHKTPPFALIPVVRKHITERYLQQLGYMKEQRVAQTVLDGRGCEAFLSDEMVEKGLSSLSPFENVNVQWNNCRGLTKRSLEVLQKYLSQSQVQTVSLHLNGIYMCEEQVIESLLNTIGDRLVDIEVPPFLKLLFTPTVKLHPRSAWNVVLNDVSSQWVISDRLRVLHTYSNAALGRCMQEKRLEHLEELEMEGGSLDSDFAGLVHLPCGHPEHVTLGWLPLACPRLQHLAVRRRHGIGLKHMIVTTSCTLAPEDVWKEFVSLELKDWKISKQFLASFVQLVPSVRSLTCGTAFVIPPVFTQISVQQSVQSFVFPATLVLLEVGNVNLSLPQAVEALEECKHLRSLQLGFERVVGAVQVVSTFEVGQQWPLLETFACRGTPCGVRALVLHGTRLRSVVVHACSTHYWERQDIPSIANLDLKLHSLQLVGPLPHLHSLEVRQLCGLRVRSTPALLTHLAVLLCEGQVNDAALEPLIQSSVLQSFRLWGSVDVTDLTVQLLETSTRLESVRCVGECAVTQLALVHLFDHCFSILNLHAVKRNGFYVQLCRKGHPWDGQFYNEWHGEIHTQRDVESYRCGERIVCDSRFWCKYCAWSNMDRALIRCYHARGPVGMQRVNMDLLDITWSRVTSLTFFGRVHNFRLNAPRLHTLDAQGIHNIVQLRAPLLTRLILKNCNEMAKNHVLEVIKTLEQIQLVEFNNREQILVWCDQPHCCGSKHLNARLVHGLQWMHLRCASLRQMIIDGRGRFSVAWGKQLQTLILDCASLQYLRVAALSHLQTLRVMDGELALELVDLPRCELETWDSFALRQLRVTHCPAITFPPEFSSKQMNRLQVHAPKTQWNINPLDVIDALPSLRLCSITTVGTCSVWELRHHAEHGGLEHLEVLGCVPHGEWLQCCLSMFPSLKRLSVGFVHPAKLEPLVHPTLRGVCLRVAHVEYLDGWEVNVEQWRCPQLGGVQIQYKKKKKWIKMDRE